MRIIFIKPKQQSGNHGSDSEKKKTDDAKAPNWAPKQSKQKFIAPVTVPVKKSPSLKDIVRDLPLEGQEKEEILPESNPPEIHLEDNSEEQANPLSEILEEHLSDSKAQTENEVQPNPVKPTEPEIIPEVPEEISSESKVERVQEVIPDTINQGETQPAQESQDTFMTHWNNMLDTVFHKVPTVYYTLKNYLPDKLENDILITVKNELQKEEIEGRQREILSYLRNNYNNEIEKIKINIDADLESKVTILDNREKMKILKEQNADINNFMEILKLKMNE
jgi:hypothetical protein